MYHDDMMFRWAVCSCGVAKRCAAFDAMPNVWRVGLVVGIAW